VRAGRVPLGTSPVDRIGHSGRLDTCGNGGLVAPERRLGVGQPPPGAFVDREFGRVALRGDQRANGLVQVVRGEQLPPPTR
jgi:hypothetical protein